MKLDRLSKSDIKRIINSFEETNFKSTISYNFSINSDESGQWKCTENDGKLIPVSLDNNTIQINLRENDHGTRETNSVSDEISFEANIDSQPHEDASLTTKDLISSEPVLTVDRCSGKLISTTLDNNSTQINLLGNVHNTHETRSVSDEIMVEVNIEPQPHENASSTTKDLVSPEPLTVNRCSDAAKKRKLWEACKKKVNKEKLTVGAIAFAKQKGYSPWPCRIISFTKTRSSATVEYFGYNRLTGSVKLNEIVQIDEDTLDEIGSVIHFMTTSGNVRELKCFLKAINEFKMVTQSVTST